MKQILGERSDRGGALHRGGESRPRHDARGRARDRGESLRPHRDDLRHARRNARISREASRRVQGRVTVGSRRDRAASGRAQRARSALDSRLPESEARRARAARGGDRAGWRERPGEDELSRGDLLSPAAPIAARRAGCGARHLRRDGLSPRGRRSRARARTTCRWASTGSAAARRSRSTARSPSAWPTRSAPSPR